MNYQERQGNGKKLLQPQRLSLCGKKILEQRFLAD
jgi:hypothetical protein